MWCRIGRVPSIFVDDSSFGLDWPWTRLNSLNGPDAARAEPCLFFRIDYVLYWFIYLKYKHVLNPPEFFLTKCTKVQNFFFKPEKNPLGRVLGTSHPGVSRSENSFKISLKTFQITSFAKILSPQPPTHPVKNGEQIAFPTCMLYNLKTAKELHELESTISRLYWKQKAFASCRNSSHKNLSKLPSSSTPFPFLSPPTPQLGNIIIPFSEASSESQQQP